MNPAFHAIVAATLSASACAQGQALVGPRHTTYRGKDAAYRVGALPPSWRKVRIGDVQIAFHHERGGAIAASGRCGERDDAPLDVLVNHLIMGLDRRREISREPITLDGRRALRAQLTGELDGVTVAMELVVLNKDGCTYDLQLVADPAVFAARRQDFAGFLAGFAHLQGR